MLLLDHNCSIKRSVTVGTNGRSQMQSLYTNVSCLVLPMNTTTAIENGFSIGRAYEIYFDISQDVQTGDQVSFNSDTYYVRLTQPFNVALVGHIKAMAEMELP